MSDELCGGCVVYLDDLVVYSDSWFSHMQQVRALFDRLAEAKLAINLAKCEFCLYNCDFPWLGGRRGHVISGAVSTAEH